MELPHLGQHCSKPDCRKLDFLPVKCQACGCLFCPAHFDYSSHDCPEVYKLNNRVPVCPLCEQPVPIKQGELPDYVVGLHIDNDCQSDPARKRRKIFTNKCHFDRCKTKEIVPVICQQCLRNYCLKHRLPADHRCPGSNAGNPVKGKENSMKGGENSISGPRNSNVKGRQSQLDEDEDLARAISLSLNHQENTSRGRSSDRCVLS
ncbi:unnamed protein product [Phyllotreta striolata]|uniref:AN1-type domain-containing protein n=1 Tax=Phyllotreta striolata TaxID=444603 RepID=A0A9N9XN52_PHYSR|nr:unnamed protein product [Phyllotreta striolata]